VTSYVELSFELGPLDPEGAEAACFTCGAVSVTFVDSRDDPILEPLPGEFRLWPATRLQALFVAAEFDHLVQALSETLGITPALIQARKVEDRVWEREWLKDFHAMRFGRRLWICPHHESVSDPEAVVVYRHPSNNRAVPEMARCPCLGADPCDRLRLRIGGARRGQCEAGRGRGALF
jgi:ribosomal protein L11 methyltransferase